MIWFYICSTLKTILELHCIPNPNKHTDYHTIRNNGKASHTLFHHVSNYVNCNADLGTYSNLLQCILIDMIIWSEN